MLNHGVRESQEEIRNALNAMHCYDLMRNSTKVILFETTIPFQLAFYALVEHDAEVASIWDPVRKVFVAMMSVRDYVHMLHVYHARNLPLSELPSQTVLDMLHPSYKTFSHADFQPVDAEDTVYQLCLQFLRSDVDFIPVVDPDNGNLVAVLGHLDILFLLSQISQEYPNLFAFTIGDLGLGSFTDILTAPANTPMIDVLRVMDERRLKVVPIVKEDGSLVGLYRGSNISFITKAVDPDVAISNFASHHIGDVVNAEILHQPTESSYFAAAGTPPAVADPAAGGAGAAASARGMGLGSTVTTCSLSYSLKSVIESMITMRCCEISCVDENAKFLGIVTARDVLHYYCHSS
jgi:5'-AMP-activated protein kinase regulatory gamma subunit